MWFVNPIFSKLSHSAQPRRIHIYFCIYRGLTGIVLNSTFYDNETPKWYSTPVHDPVPADCFLPDFISHREPGAFLSNLSVNAQGCHYSHQMSPLWPLNLYQLGFYILQSTSSLSPGHDTVTVLLVKLTGMRSANRLWCHHHNDQNQNVLVWASGCGVLALSSNGSILKIFSSLLKNIRVVRERGKRWEKKEWVNEWVHEWINTPNYRVTHVSYHYTDHQPTCGDLGIIRLLSCLFFL